MQEEDNKPAQTIVEEGEHVTGGEGAAESQDTNTGQGQANANTQNDEVKPEHDNKKEDMTSYNEHPDQEKVGGG